MATLNSSNIVNGNTIQTTDILQLYNALNFSAAPETFLVSISGSLLGTSSFATTAVTAQTASFVTTAQTASFVTTAQTASFVTTAQTASVALNGGVTQITAGPNITVSPGGTGNVTITSAGGGAFPFTGSGAITGSLEVTGSTTSTLGFTGSLLGTSSQAQTASFVTTAQTASFVTTAQTASVALTAQTASFVIPVNNSSGAINYSLALVSGSIPQSLAFDTDVIYNPVANQLTVTNLSSSAIITTSITGSSIFASSSFQTSGSITRRFRTITLTNADFSSQPSISISSSDDIILIIDQTTTSPAAPNGRTINIAPFLASPAGRCVEIIRTNDATTGAGIVLTATSMGGAELYLNNLSQPDAQFQMGSFSGQSITIMSSGLSPTGSAWGNGYV